MVDPCRESKHSRLTDGKGKVSVIIASLSARKSAQNLYDPSDFGTNNIGEEYGEFEDSLSPSYH